MPSPRSWTDLVAHIVWAAKNRERLLLPAMDDDLAILFRRKARALRCTLLAAGFADDHVHVLARYPTDCAVSTLVQSLKGSSSREHNREADPQGLVLYWQDGSWIESCGPSPSRAWCATSAVSASTTPSGIQRSPGNSRSFLLGRPLSVLLIGARLAVGSSRL
ncbi:MAG: IS200/IS605 family transposase [Deltaproteobacteria bacterium]